MDDPTPNVEAQHDRLAREHAEHVYWCKPLLYKTCLMQDYDLPHEASPLCTLDYL